MNSGYRVTLDPSTLVVQPGAVIVYGGIESDTVRATKTEGVLEGQVAALTNVYPNSFTPPIFIRS